VYGTGADLYPLDDRQYVRDRAGGGQEVWPSGRQDAKATQRPGSSSENTSSSRRTGLCLGIRDQGVPAEPERQGNAPLLAL